MLLHEIGGCILWEVYSIIINDGDEISWFQISAVCVGKFSGDCGKLRFREESRDVRGFGRADIDAAEAGWDQ